MNNAPSQVPVMRSSMPNQRERPKPAAMAIVQTGQTALAERALNGSAIILNINARVIFLFMEKSDKIINYGARGGTRTLKSYDIRTSNVRVYQFRHPGKTHIHY